MKHIIKISCILAVCSLLFVNVIAMNTNASETYKNWSEAYLKAMDDYSKEITTYCDCMLVYLDDDNVPEFYIGDPMSEAYGGLYSYSKGELVKLRDFKFRDFFSEYSKNKGIFRNDYYIERNGSKTGTKFIKLENNTLTVLDELTHDVVNSVYEVNGKTVNKDIYDKKIAEYTLTKPDSAEIMTYDKMKNYLLTSPEEIPTAAQTTSASSQTASDSTTTQTTATTSTAAVTTSSTSSSTTAETTTTTTTVQTTTITVQTTTSNTSASSSKSTTTSISTTAKTTTTTKYGSPKTGNSETIAMEWAVIGLSAAGIITALLLTKSKNKNNY